jgi:hypothetical protein
MYLTTLSRELVFAGSLLAITPLCAGIPAETGLALLFTTIILFYSLPAALFSSIITAFIFQRSKKSISYGTAFSMSLVSTLSSTILGAYPLCWLLDIWPFTFTPDSSAFLAVLLVYGISSIIGLAVTCLTFRSTAQQLWIPVLAGNGIATVTLYLLLRLVKILI